jgi:aspartyl-tRNA(Asn)/glutamyl-tRNA(Gln) amidotransferase subunit A
MPTSPSSLAGLIRSRQVSSAEVVRAHLERVEAINPELNAIVTLADGALDAAKAADEVLASGAEVGPLHGVPFTVKDSFDTPGCSRSAGRRSSGVGCRTLTPPPWRV